MSRAAEVRSTCPYCGVGCGVRVQAHPDAFVVAGDPEHPANRGRLCSKGAALAETLTLDGRLLHPSIRGRRASWDEALEAVAQGFARVIAAHGPEAVAFYVSGQLLTEDYYVANKLMKGYIGSANIDTNSRLCMSSAVAAHKRAFGEDLVPGCYEDLELADLVVLAGSNLAWCHPVLFQRLQAAREARPDLKVVVIDPRRTATAEIADLHLAIAPGSDVWLWNGLLAALDARGAVDRRYVDAHTRGFDEALAVARATAGGLDAVAQATGLPAADLARFYDWFARTERVVSAFSQGMNQSSSGTDKGNALINCHLATGRIGRAGMGPLSLTGQPNAMGGREVGGLANQLAAHRELDDAGDRAFVQAFWGSPRIAAKAGLKAVELFDAIHAGRVKAVWIMATNPVVSLPDADRVRAALAGCEFVVVSDCIATTDTTAFAQVLLPAAAWGEKDGTVTNSERRISRQRAFRSPPGEARPDWWMVAEVARRMGFAGFDFASPAEVFREHAALASPSAGPSRRLDLGGLASLCDAGYQQLEPVQWPLPAGTRPGALRLCGDGVFPTLDGRARFVATAPRGPAHAPDADFPLRLNTGRVRDQWHTMTRTGLAARLGAHRPEPFIDVHPDDATRLGVHDGGLARVVTRWGAFVGRAQLTDEVRRGELFAPIHWSGTHASAGRIGATVNPVVDPVSGEPEFKHTPARLEAIAAARCGVVLTRRSLATEGLDYWARVRTDDGWRYEFALTAAPADAGAWLRAALDVPDGADCIEYLDAARGVVRMAIFDNGGLTAYAALAPTSALPERDWLAQLFAATRLGDAARVELLAGRPLAPRASAGPTVCSCFGVGRDTILAAVRAQGLCTPREVTACLKAGGNCGSCLPEIGRLVATAAQAPEMGTCFISNRK